MFRKFHKLLEWKHVRKYFIFICVLVASGFSRAGGVPLHAKEREALDFLDYVTGPLPATEEKEWWNIGGKQFGLFSTSKVSL